MIKFNAINQQHADIAAKQLSGLGVKSVAIGRAVVADYDWSNEVIKIMTEAMGYSLEEITEFDLKELERCQN